MIVQFKFQLSFSLNYKKKNTLLNLEGPELIILYSLQFMTFDDPFDDHSLNSYVIFSYTISNIQRPSLYLYFY